MCDPDQSMKTAKNTYDRLQNNILNIVRAADLHCLHLIYKLRKQEIPEEILEAVVSKDKITGFNIFSGQYEEQELSFLEKNETLKSIGQQILIASHTAFEVFLKSKFAEYFRYRSKDADKRIVEQSLKHYNWRSIDEVKDNYKGTLGIHLPSFEFDFFIADKGNFQPKSCWEGIKLIEKARHEIVHQGRSELYAMVTLVDSWYPFDFLRLWVTMFVGNFDTFIYGGRTTELVREHFSRARENGIIID